jgi:hypothetical protein
MVYWCCWEVLVDYGRIAWQKVQREYDEAPHAVYESILREFDFIVCVGESLLPIE